mgnify:CR=1 FL=1
MSTFPTSRLSKTLLGVCRELEIFTGRQAANDIETTLNSKHNVFPERVPTRHTTLKYFGIGIGGRFNVNDDNLTAPHAIKTTNMDLYRPIPFRCVPVEQDLTPDERVNYRIRALETIRGEQYICYYLKALNFLDNKVVLTETNPVTGNEEQHILDVSELTPTPPATTPNGREDQIEVNATVSVGLPITGEEVTEAINVMFDGDLRRAVISEIGLYAGEDATVSTTDVSGSSFTYTEAILAQLVAHYTFNGSDLSRPDSVFNPKLKIGKDDLIVR